MHELASRGRRPAILLAAVLLLPVSCGGGGGGTAGGTIRIAGDIVQGVGPVFDPVRFPGGLYPWMALMYDTMIHVGKAGLEPGLAVRWAFPDTRTVDLTLRRGTRFQDGTPFNAAAVKTSWDRVIASRTMTKTGGIAAMRSVEAPADDHVILHLSQPLAADFRDRYLEQATSLAVLSPAALASAGPDLSANPVNAGAGPYAFASYTPNQKIVLRRWKGYYNPDGQRLDGVEYINAAAGAPTVGALAGGAADIAFLTGSDINAARASGLGERDIVPSDQYYGFDFCTNKPPFNNLQARQAVQYALNRQDFVTTAFGGHAQVDQQFVPRTSPYYAANLADPYPHDVSRAKAALAGAGVASGTAVTILADATPVDNAVLQTLQDQLRAIGLNLVIKTSPNAFADLPKVVPDIYYLGGGSNYIAHSAFILPGGAGNFCKLNSSAITEAWSTTRDVTLDNPGLRTAWAGFQRVVNDNLPLFVVANPAIGVAHSSRVTGVDSLTLDPSQGAPAAWASIGMREGP